MPCFRDLIKDKKDNYYKIDTIKIEYRQSFLHFLSAIAIIKNELF